MNITINQQRDYIENVANRVIKGDLDRMAGVYRIDTMTELAPSLKLVAKEAIDRIYSALNDPEDLTPTQMKALNDWTKPSKPEEHKCFDNLNPGGYCKVCGSGKDYS